MKPATDVTDIPDTLLMGGPSATAAALAPDARGEEVIVATVAPRHRSRLGCYVELAKPRMNFLVVLTTLVGYAMAADRVTGNGLHLLWTLLGTALTAAGASVLNQYVERGYDRLMHRTRNRPLPAGRVAPLEAQLLGVALALAGVGVLA